MVVSGFKHAVLGARLLRSAINERCCDQHLAKGTVNPRLTLGFVYKWIPVVECQLLR